MKDYSRVKDSSASHLSITHAVAPLPWLPLAPPSSVGSSAVHGSSASERWAAALQSVPYLRSIAEGPLRTVYRPPTVIQLSEASGCSVSKLAGAYSDLPVITLKKVVSTSDQELRGAEQDLSFDGFEYLQLSPTDDSLEMAAKAMMARRPVADAEEIYWEANYWEVLRRAKRDTREKKERHRTKKRLQMDKKAVARASQSSAMMPSPNVGPAPTSSTMNSPSFATPHSRQGSTGGLLGEGGERSPANLPPQTAAQRTARGLLRRARYNETHNPIQSLIMRSSSLLSQSSATQSLIRCRTRRRHDSITSQSTLTGARGFQYPLSSVASDDGRSATSDSLRTPLPHLLQRYQSRELLATSLELDLSASCEPTNTVIHTNFGLALADPARADTTENSELLRSHKIGDLSQALRNDAMMQQPSSVVAASPISLVSIHTPQNHRSFDLRCGNTSSRICSDTTSPKSWIIHRDYTIHALGVTPTPSPNLELSASHCPPLSLLENEHGKEGAGSPFALSALRLEHKPENKQQPEAERRIKKQKGGSAPKSLPSTSHIASSSKTQRKSNGRSSVGTSSVTPDMQPISPCTTARPSVGSTHASARASVSLHPLMGRQSTLPQSASGNTPGGGAPKANGSSAARSPTTQEATARPSQMKATKNFTAAARNGQGDSGKRAASRVDTKPLSPNPGTARSLSDCRRDGGAASAQSFNPSSMQPATVGVTAVAAPLSSTSPHPTVSLPTVQTPAVLQAAAVRKSERVTAAVILSSVMVSPTATGSSPSSSLTLRGTAPTLPSSRTPTREVSLSLRPERAATSVCAALPSELERGPDTMSLTPSPRTHHPCTATKSPSALGTSCRAVEVPLESLQSTLPVLCSKEAKCGETRSLSAGSSTISKNDTIPPRSGKDRADKSAATRSSSILTAHPGTGAGLDTHHVLKSSTVDTSSSSKRKNKQKVLGCCAVM